MIKNYVKNFLTHVICAIDFPELEEFQSAKIAKFQKKIRSKFTEVEVQKGYTISHKIDSGKPKTYSEEIERWVFKSKANNYLVNLEVNRLIIETTLFESYSEFEDIIKLVINSFFEIFKDIMTTRLGLRYINQIIFPEDTDLFVWQEYINNSLLANLDFDESKTNLSRYLNQFEWKLDDSRLRFQYGIVNKDFPQKIKNKEFVLDYDCFNFKTLDEENIFQEIDSFRKIINEKFEASIKEELRKKMRGEDDE